LFDAVAGLKERFSSASFASFAAAVVVVSSPPSGTVMNIYYIYGKECVSDVIGILTRSAHSIALFSSGNKKTNKNALKHATKKTLFPRTGSMQMKCLSPRSSYFFLAAPLRSLFVVVRRKALFI
jgi:hypothetical protein